MPGKLRDKVDTAWYEGIWLGKDAEAESLVFGQGGHHAQGSYCATCSSVKTM